MTGRKRASRLMKKMGIEALYRKSNLSRRPVAYPIFRYFLRPLKTDRSNHIWATDITYLPMRWGFVYLIAVIDGYSRKVLSWRFFNTRTTDFCINAVREALSRYDKPEIVDTDQGRPYMSHQFTQRLKYHEIRIRRDGKGGWRDNVFVEWLWKSVKYEKVSLKAYDSISAAKANLDAYLNFFNTRRWHPWLDGKTPDTINYADPPQEDRGRMSGLSTGRRPRG
jgi:putative transposase